MTSEIICAIIAAGGTVLSALIAWFVSRSTASKEIEKMKLTWEREDVVSSDDEFADMTSAVAVFVKDNWPDKQIVALSLVARARSKEIGEIAHTLDDLYFIVEAGNIPEVDRLLTKVIDQKREAKSHSHTSSRNNPKR